MDSALVGHLSQLRGCHFGRKAGSPLSESYFPALINVVQTGSRLLMGSGGRKIKLL